MYFWQQWKILSQLKRLPHQRLVQLTEMLQGKAMGMAEPATTAASVSAQQHVRRRDASMQAQTEGLGQEDTMLGQVKHVTPMASTHPHRHFDPSMQAHADGLGQEDMMFAAHARSISTTTEKQVPSARKTNGGGTGKGRDHPPAIEQLLSPDAPEDVLKRATNRLNPQEKMHLRQLVMKAHRPVSPPGP